MRQVTLGHVLGAVLAVLALALSVIAAVAISRTIDHRRDYEAEVAQAYRVEAAGWRLTAAEGVALEAEGAALVRLARDDERSARLATRLRRAATSGSREAAIAAADALAGRQGDRRAEARQELDDRDDATLLAAAGAGGVALLVALGGVAFIAARMRAPVEELAGAARSLLGERKPGRGGPAELRSLAAALAAFDADRRRPQLPAPRGPDAPAPRGRRP